jgi:metallo-beta-lactamase class B
MNRLLLNAVLCGCAAAPAVVEQPRDVSFSTLSAGVWRYETRTNQEHQVLHANGLIFATAEGPVVVDAAWRDDQAATVFDFVQQTLHQVPAWVVVTHSHTDRSGGLAEVRRRGVRVAWLQRTAELLQKTTGATVANSESAHVAPGVGVMAEGDLRFTDVAQLNGDVELFFPGAGHAPDNIVVWHRPSETLYGGCFIKALEQDIGWLQDADVTAWPHSLDRVLERYPTAARVVPGHGEPGGLELIAHTRALAEAQRTRQ